MPERTVQQCQCSNCQQPGDHPDKELHQQMNSLLSRLDVRTFQDLAIWCARI